MGFTVKFSFLKTIYKWPETKKTKQNFKVLKISENQGIYFQPKEKGLAIFNLQYKKHPNASNIIGLNIHNINEPSEKNR